MSYYLFFLIDSLSYFIIFTLNCDFTWVSRGRGGGGGGGGWGTWMGTQRNGVEKCMAVGRGKTLYSRQRHFFVILFFVTFVDLRCVCSLRRRSSSQQNAFFYHGRYYLYSIPTGTYHLIQNPESKGDQARPIRYPSSGLIEGKKGERRVLFRS